MTSTYLAPWENSLEPNQSNIRQWLGNLKSKFQPIEQARWNQANIDSLFYAGNQSFINNQFQFNAGISAQSYYFNLCHQPVNMVTGYQRQHRKSIIYQAVDNADPHTTDQYTKLIKNVCRKEGTDEVYSKSCELSAIAGMNLMQPYLDFTGDDPAQGQLKLKVWEYNSFIVDPFFRQPDMSDANFVWCQEYINRQVAEDRFPDQIAMIKGMSNGPQRYSDFYFLPEQYNMYNNDLLVLSYVWYKSKKKRKRLYSRTRNQFFDFSDKEKNLEQILYHIDDMEQVTVDSPCWKVAVILNDQLMFKGVNPLWDGPECPFIPNFWNYDPHLQQYDLRSRSLIFPMRSPQFLMNYKIINNNDIAAATINAGWKRKEGAVANEDNLKKSGQGWDVIIKNGFEMTDCEKIVPSAVPESDLALAQQMSDLIFKTAGIDLENWSGQNDKQVSTLTLLTKQAANLMVFQKYFDQWDRSLILVGERMLQYALQNWSTEKVALMIGEDPSPHFYSKIFAKYHTVVEEGISTPTQKNLAAQQLMDINAAFGREVFPPSMIIKNMNIQDKAEAMQFLQQQEQQASEMAQQKEIVEHAFEDAKLKELYSKAASNLATARERHGRSESNIGLFEERLSMITKNHASAQKEKMEALTKLLEAIQKHGELEVFLKENQLKSLEEHEELKENVAKIDAQQTSESNKFVEQIMQNPSSMGSNEQQGQQMPEQGQQMPQNQQQSMM